nr:transporter substrate-binding domain-containing protein [Escherichia coli]
MAPAWASLYVRITKPCWKKLNNALAAIKADGTYQKISDQWFPQ